MINRCKDCDELLHKQKPKKLDGLNEGLIRLCPTCMRRRLLEWRSEHLKKDWINK